MWGGLHPSYLSVLSGAPGCSCGKSETYGAEHVSHKALPERGSLGQQCWKVESNPLFKSCEPYCSSRLVTK